ncbi:hypothetical protein HXX76_008459 [Chlamydomonas incerta]|uniref:Uncharacterized protein n=1 Tax=Chlamydomonas incerta TaxID=51695 RepID=A0A835T8A5_CHLIN|nr:hypothetical protein HXX76_008459 [Chlamydomonas incerta]|eukprot:KAG2433401.1 hypothetical protein HXX76_008459 [Chlamydomonas incerta]
MCLAAGSGDGPSLDAALAHCGCTLTSKVLASAAAAGHRAACERLLAEGCEIGVEAACAAAQAGHLYLCSLLWSRRCEDYSSDADDAVLSDADIARLAQAACFGGRARVLKWLEDEAGLYYKAELWGWEYRRQEIDEGLAAAATRGGHVALMRRQLAKLAAPGPADGSWAPLLCSVALGCPLPVFRDLAEQWRQLEPPQPGAPAAVAKDGCAILMHALGSRTRDWKEKVDFVLSRRPELLAAVTAEEGGRPLVDRDLIRWAAAQPDFEQRLRYLVSDKGARAPRMAAGAAAGAGDVGTLRFLRDECGVGPSDGGASAAAAHGQHAVLEFLRGRGQLPICSSDGRTLDNSVAPVCVLAATAMSMNFPICLAKFTRRARCFWSRVFERAARQGADVAALRYLHEQLGVEVQLQPIAQAGSVEQLEWALGVAAGGAGAAAAQGPAPAAQHLLLAALDAGNSAVASHLHVRGLAPVLPTAYEVSRLSHHAHGAFTPGPFLAMRWLVERWRAVQVAAAGGAGAGGAAADGAGPREPRDAAAIGGAACAGGPAAEAAGGIGDEWDGLLHEVGEYGRLAGSFSEDQWKWLKAAFLASPVLPHETAASVAGWLSFPRATKSGVLDRLSKREQAAAASAGAEGSGHKTEAEARAERERERERVRVEEVMAARRLVVERVEDSFWGRVSDEESLREDVEAERRAEAEAEAEADAEAEAEADDEELLWGG